MWMWYSIGKGASVFRDQGLRREVVVVVVGDGGGGNRSITCQRRQFLLIRLDELVYWCTIVIVSEVFAKECEKSQLLRFATKES